MIGINEVPDELINLLFDRKCRDDCIKYMNTKNRRNNVQRMDLTVDDLSKIKILKDNAKILEDRRVNICMRCGYAKKHRIHGGQCNFLEYVRISFKDYRELKNKLDSTRKEQLKLILHYSKRNGDV